MVHYQLSSSAQILVSHRQLNPREDMNTFAQEVEKGQRFEFGKNWKEFLSTLSDDRIKIAENSVREMLESNNLRGKSFLDIGSGSGLFSLAARRLGATVRSFDYDPLSVACTQELRSRFFPDDREWIIEQGSMLDKEFLKSLGNFDIVYSWGVLHHTGNMWEALENITSLVKKNGILFIAIYNDQEKKSKFWWKVKRMYCSSNLGKLFVSSIFIPYAFSRTLTTSIIRNENLFSAHKKNRGMSIVNDWFDWLGGFPYEVAKVEDIFQFYKTKGFKLRNLKTTLSLGNNEFVFVKE